MPLAKSFRLSSEARNEIKRLLRGFYHRLLAKRVPDRLVATVTIDGNADRRDPPGPRAPPNQLD